MTKHEFLTELEALLGRLPEEERRDVLYDYEEHFQMGLADGKGEEDIAASLGRPKTIAKALSTGSSTTNVQDNQSETNMTRTVIVGIALVFFNLMFVFGLFFGIVGLIIGLYAAAVSMIIVPVALLFQGVLINEDHILAGIFNVMMPVGLGALMIIGLIYITRWTYILTLKYVQFNIRVAKGE